MGFTLWLHGALLGPGGAVWADTGRGEPRERVPLSAAVQLAYRTVSNVAIPNMSPFFIDSILKSRSDPCESLDPCASFFYTCLISLKRARVGDPAGDLRGRLRPGRPENRRQDSAPSENARWGLREEG